VLIGGLLVVDVVVEPGHHIGFFVGHVVATTAGFLELVLIGFRVVSGSDDAPEDGGWVGSGGIV